MKNAFPRSKSGIFDLILTKIGHFSKVSRFYQEGYLDLVFWSRVFALLNLYTTSFGLRRLNCSLTIDSTYFMSVRSRCTSSSRVWFSSASWRIRSI